MVVGADEHFVSAESVGAVAIVDDVERVDDIAFAFAHFFAVGGVDVAVIEKLLDGLAEGELALVGEEFAPEADVEEVGDGVVAAAVDVEGFPVFDGVFVPGGGGAVRGGVAPEIPRGAGVAVEGVGFAGHFFAVDGDLEPVGGFGEGRAAGVVGFEVGDFGDDDGKLVFGDGVGVTVFVVSYWDGAAPVALARDEPVAHAVGGFGSAERFFWDFGDFYYWQVELFGELAVAIVAGGDSHDGAGAVAHENVIGDPDGDFFAGGGVGGVGAGEDAGFFFVFLAFDFGFFDGRFAVLFDGFAGFVGDEGFDEGMFGS